MVASGRIKERIRDRLYRDCSTSGPGFMGRESDRRGHYDFVDGVEALERYFGVARPQLFVPLIGSAVIVTSSLSSTLSSASRCLPARSSCRSRRPSHGSCAIGREEWWSLYSRIYTENLDAIQGMPTLKAFDAAERRGRQLHEDAARFSAASVRLSLISVMYPGVVGLAESTGTALAVGIGALRFADGPLALPGLMASCSSLAKLPSAARLPDRIPPGLCGDDHL